MKKYRSTLLLLISACAALAMLFQGRIPQDPAYHQFADTRKIAGIPNFWNVFSNLPFLIVGLYGFSRIKRMKENAAVSGYRALCAGVTFVSAGSAYYHWSPSVHTLLWDRLPMTVAFMAMFALLLEERVLNAKILHPFLAVGVGAAVYWYWTETRGAGDLRLYALVQFLPILMIPLILVLYEPKYLDGKLFTGALVFYAAAKVCESYDGRVMSLLILSGHTIKHALAAGATLCIILAVPSTSEVR